MSRRKYRQSARLASTEATRQKIVEATAALHAEQGILATSMKDIAERADVGIGTVYHHFPTIDDIVRACGALMHDRTRPPGPEVLDGITEPERRIARLVEAFYAYYARHPAYERARCDQDRLPVLAEAVAGLERQLETVVRAALGPAAEEAVVRLVLGVTDFAVYRTLTRGGTSTEAAAAQLTELLVTWLGWRSQAARR